MYTIYRIDTEAILATAYDADLAEFIAAALTERLGTKCASDYEVPDPDEEEYECYDDSFDECGFDPYEGCYTWDC